MQRLRKPYAWGIVAVVLVLISLGSLLIAARMIKSDQLLENLNALVSRKISGKVTFEKIGISYFPRPRLKIQGCRIEGVENYQVVIPALIVTPQILPLFSGRFQVAAATVQMPEVHKRQTEGVGDAGTPVEVFKKIAAVISTATSIPEGFSLRIYGGRFTVARNHSTRFTLRHLNLRITKPKDTVLLDIQSKSDHFERLAFNGHIDPDNRLVKGQLDAKAVRLPSYAASLPFLDGLALKSAPIDLSVAITTAGMDSLQATVSGAVSSVSITRPREEFSLGAQAFSGSLHLDKTRTAFHISKWVMEKPRMVLSGKLEAGPIQTIAGTPAQLEITTTDADIDSARKVVQFVAGTNPVVETVIKIVRGGRVPSVTLTSSGKRLMDIGKMENILIRGFILNGNIHIPGTGLDPEGVTGEVTISKNFLKGHNLKARYGDSKGKNGTLIMVWEKEDTLFNLDIDVQADLAQLPPLLKRWIDDNQFDAEMDRLDQVKGRANGKLMLSGTLDEIITRAQIPEFNLFLKYRRFPYIIRIDKGRCDIKPHGIQIESLSGNAGGSLLSGITGNIDWQKETRLAIHAGGVEMETEEIDPWIRSFEGFRRYKEVIHSVRGTISLDDIQLSGPMFEPDRWKLDIKGRAREIAVENPHFSAPLHIGTGRFRIMESQGLSSAIFQKAQVQIADRPLQLTGWLKNYTNRIDKGRIHLDGELHPEVIQLLYQSLGITKGSHFPEPRPQLSVTGGRLTWDKEKMTRFKGELSIAGGPLAKIDLYTAPETFRIDHLEIRDRESSALMQYVRVKERMEMAFSGYLTARTLDAFFADYPDPLKRGWLRGEIRIDIDRNPQIAVTGEGDLRGRHIFLPEFLKTPLNIEAIVLNVLEDRFAFENTQVTWKGKHFKVEGTVERPDRFWRTDLALTADLLDWGWIKEATHKLKGVSDGSSMQFQEIPVRGNVEVIADRFVLGELEWKPLNADIVMNREGIEIAFAKAYQCGIDSPGVVTIKGEKISLEALPYAKDLDLQPVLDCLKKDAVLATGKVDVSGRLSSTGTLDNLLTALEGTLKFNIRNGRIYRHIPLARLFTFLDLIEILKKINPALEKEGFPFRHILINSRIKGGKMIIDEGLVDSPIMEIAVQGNVDLVNHRINLDVLAAPMQSVNYLIKKMPMVGQVMGGTLISIPLKIEGHRDDPKVTILPHKMVSEGLIRIMKRILKLPFTMIEPIVPDP